MDAIFKALNDASRRALLDALKLEDGQSLSDLEARLDMTRFGVMKHLKVLEDASLITTVKRGRFKYHYLNALPLQEVIDRWIDPLLAKPAARATLDLKSRLEGAKLMLDDAKKPDLVMHTFIRCTRDALWDALSDPGQMSAWHFLSPKVVLEDDTYTYHTPDGGVMMRCRTIEATPKSKIVSTFEPEWEGGGAPSRTVFLIDEEGAHCRLTIEHYDLTFPVVPGEGVHDGWQRWAAGLKTYLETGEAVRFNQWGAGA
ncbi:ArsR/SmtB family transcription factor [Anianabacter salinae]|uniref:ArsR/SmtB family transcription factor n=1 Tax=Anianabacter salinae TaxID=2851023 RepID=UPI00225E251A|nr:SRPBCC domain-containing protein [Anianabacter salinae]MBV0912568.1 helix-turn-helix domain-containing protein [Anianabacter salinae]